MCHEQRFVFHNVFRHLLRLLRGTVYHICDTGPETEKPLKQIAQLQAEKVTPPWAFSLGFGGWSGL